VAEKDAFVRYVTAKLRELRKANGVTGEQLAERLGIAVQNLRRIEAGQNITLATLARVAKALGFQVKVTFVRLRRSR
jgi:transcriptional regulator with XRE-family HTH domain